MNIETRLNSFFLQNMAYCAAVKHRNPAASIFNLPKTTIELDSDKLTATILQIDEWVDNVLSTTDEENVHILYYYFVDKEALVYLRDKVFNKVEFSKFEQYFKYALHELVKLSLTTGNYYKYVNFYHLIGSMRLIPGCDDEVTADKIISYLSTILMSDKLPLIIKFSARQILLDRYYDRLNNKMIKQIEAYNTILRAEIESNSDITKFLALYYLYYYDFSYNIGQLVTDLREKLAGLSGSILSANLYMNIPQLHALIIRKRFHKNITKRIGSFYRIKNEAVLLSNIDNVLTEIASAGGTT